MNILLTGGSGFVGRSIKSQLSSKYNILGPSSSELDLTQKEQLKEYMWKNDFQYIINCAVKGGRRTRQDTEKDFYTNVKILDNLLWFVSNQSYSPKLITFSSGAEFQLDPSFYGLSKKVCTSLVKNKLNIKNLRIYNVFGELGMEDSFVYTAIEKCLSNEDIVIWDDKQFDTFYINDLITLVNKLIVADSSTYEEIDCVYPEHHKLSYIAKLIKSICNSISNIIVEKDSNSNYTGLAAHDMSSFATPLEVSLTNMVKYINQR